MKKFLHNPFPLSIKLNNHSWILFWIITFGLTIFCLLFPVQNFGGDIVEYHGITESLLKSSSLHLTEEVQWNLEKSLQPAYLQDPTYYVTGRNDERYPVHFIFYSLLALPVRLVLKLLSINELSTLRFTNLLLLSGTVWYILRSFIHTSFQRTTFLILVYLSPIIWFLLWPGPDIYYLCMLLLGLFFFFHNKYLVASIFTILASWHSQPLVILSLGSILFYLARTIQTERTNGTTYIRFLLPSLAISFGLIMLLSVPYLYNLYAFGTLTPWTIFEEGWTMIYGFGIQNARIGKFIEQLFDLNFGLFWYAPLIMLLGFFGVIKSAQKNRTVLLVLLGFVVSMFFYQTNPAWHYGTSGYGPSRHILFLLPLLIYFAALSVKPLLQYKIILGLLILNQLNVMQFNGYLAPDLLNTLKHSPYAEFALNNYPSLYNPTPEIFVDRTNHEDLKYPTGAIYKRNGVCKKIYALQTDDFKYLQKECPNLPSSYQSYFDNEFLRKTNFARTTQTIDATFWPDPGSCGDDYFPIDEKSFVCLKTKDEAMKAIGIVDPERLEPVDDLKGVWRITRGNPVTITIPPGYFIQHYAFTGAYINL